MKWNAYSENELHFVSHFHLQPFQEVLLAFFGEREFSRNKHDGTKIYIRISHIEIICYAQFKCLCLTHIHIYTLFNEFWLQWQTEYLFLCIFMKNDDFVKCEK